MNLVIGGAYQGKLTWAVAQYGWKQEELLDLAKAEPQAARCWYHLEEWTWRKLQAGESAAALLERLEPVLPEVVISREIGSGVVPMDPAERRWREETGRLCCALAREARMVVRLCCGLPQILKAPEGDEE